MQHPCSQGMQSRVSSSGRAAPSHVSMGCTARNGCVMWRQRARHRSCRRPTRACEHGPHPDLRIVISPDTQAARPQARRTGRPPPRRWAPQLQQCCHLIVDLSLSAMLEVMSSPVRGPWARPRGHTRAAK